MLLEVRGNGAYDYPASSPLGGPVKSQLTLLLPPPLLHQSLGWQGKPRCFMCTAKVY
jgi:hypothetical protein